MPVKAPAAVISQTFESKVMLSPLSPSVTTALASRVPLAVKPLVAVINPEMVGVAVQAVPVTVRLPPKEVKLLPETVKVLSSVVAPCRVNAPGVVADPMVLTDEAPAPMVLVEAPVPIVVDPEEVKVVTPETAPALIIMLFIVLVAV